MTKGFAIGASEVVIQVMPLRRRRATRGRCRGLRRAEHDERRLAAPLERGDGYVLGGVAHHLARRVGAAGEGHRGDPGVAGQRPAAGLAEAGDDVDHAGWKAACSTIRANSKIGAGPASGALSTTLLPKACAGHVPRLRARPFSPAPPPRPSFSQSVASCARNSPIDAGGHRRCGQRRRTARGMIPLAHCLRLGQFLVDGRMLRWRTLLVACALAELTRNTVEPESLVTL